MANDTKRFTTTTQNIARLQTFEKHGVLVICKFCRECAIIRKVESLKTTPTTLTARAVCPNCGKKWELSYVYEKLPFWLSTDVRNHRVWALNEAHLNWLESFIGAELRESQVGGSSALHAILPRWMTSRKNRTVVMKAFAKLREKIPASN